jgi:hypothetical protein
MPSNEDSKVYELQVCCKDYAFMGTDKLVGSASVGLGPIHDQGKCTTKVRFSFKFVYRRSCLVSFLS